MKGGSDDTPRLTDFQDYVPLGSAPLVCCRCTSPTVREGSVAIRVGALPYRPHPSGAAPLGTPGRANAPLAMPQQPNGALPAAWKSGVALVPRPLFIENESCQPCPRVCPSSFPLTTKPRGWERRCAQSSIT